MPPKGNKRRYANFDDASLKAAIADVGKGISLREAASTHGLNRQTLSNKLNEKHLSSYGRQPELTPEVESMFADRIKQLGEWGFPVVKVDICMFVKGYLDCLGVTSRRWDENLPGSKWAKNFIKRNGLSERLITNITRKRAAVDDVVINNYFDELSISLAGIPPENILNYDETGLTDDPGKKKMRC